MGADEGKVAGWRFQVPDCRWEMGDGRLQDSKIPAPSFPDSQILRCLDSKSPDSQIPKSIYMKEFNFSIDSFQEILQKLAQELAVEVKNERLEFPESTGQGYFRVMSLPNKLDVLLMDFKLNEDFWFNRGRTDKEHYVFVCEEIITGGEMVIDLDGDKMLNDSSEISGMHLFSFLSDLRQFGPKDTRVRGFRVVITPEWLASYLRIDKMEDVLHKYLELKVARMHMKELDSNSSQMLHEILDHTNEIRVDEMAYIQNRIMMVLESFFSWMWEEMTKNPRLTRISKEDINRIRGVEDFLLNDLSKAPGIDELARHAAMSATRLKTLFRHVYGLPPYEYFQQHRMLKAKELLKETKLPIQEIGRSLGYSNMSNFTLAFRKVFKINPSEIR